ncbi:MAG: response regulator transcription factor [Sphingomonadales bacterium]
MQSAKHAYVVDDEDAIRRSLTLMLRLAGWGVSQFDSGTAFLDQSQTLEPNCVLLDVRMPGMDGLEVQRELIRRGIDFPIVMMTGHGEIPVAVAALKGGAVDFLEKPFQKARLLAALDNAWLKLSDPEAYRRVRHEAATILEALSGPERRVLDAFAQGFSNRGVADALGLAVTEVERCRASLVEKLGGSSLPDAIRIAYLAQSTG